MELVPRRKRQLTQPLPKEFTRDEFVAPEVVRWHCNGLTISGRLYRPPRKRGLLPANLYVHGGPTAQSQNEWLAPVQHLVSQGYVVLAPNYRGSTGYLTMSALTRHPQVFAVGSAIVPFFNWFTEHENERADFSIGMSRTLVTRSQMPSAAMSIRQSFTCKILSHQSCGRLSQAGRVFEQAPGCRQANHQR